MTFVWLDGAGLFATVTNGTSADQLARVDGASGKATHVGSTDLCGISGLGRVGGELYGLTKDGAFVLLDPASGRATSLDPIAGESFSDAGAPAR